MTRFMRMANGAAPRSSSLEIAEMHVDEDSVAGGPHSRSRRREGI